jgi:hypothetical protein
MRKKVEKIVFRQKRLYRAKNGQFLKTHGFPPSREKKKPHPKERAFRDI